MGLWSAKPDIVAKEWSAKVGWRGDPRDVDSCSSMAINN